MLWDKDIWRARAEVDRGPSPLRWKLALQTDYICTYVYIFFDSSLCRKSLVSGEIRLERGCSAAAAAAAAADEDERPWKPTKPAAQAQLILFTSNNQNQ